MPLSLSPDEVGLHLLYKEKLNEMYEGLGDLSAHIRYTRLAELPEDG